jgi:hypothetical protein
LRLNPHTLTVVKFDKVEERRLHTRSIRRREARPHAFDEGSFAPLLQTTCVELITPIEASAPAMNHTPHDSHKRCTIVVFPAPNLAPIIVYPSPKLLLLMDHVRPIGREFERLVHLAQPTVQLQLLVERHSELPTSLSWQALNCVKTQIDVKVNGRSPMCLKMSLSDIACSTP